MDKFKVINIYNYGMCKTTIPARPGSYVALLQYNNVTKYIAGFETGTTSNRMIITAMIKAVELIKEPCEIHFYNTTKVGFSKIFKDGKYKLTSEKDNGDLLNQLSILLSNGKHKYEEHITLQYKGRLIPYMRQFDKEYAEFLEQEQPSIKKDNVSIIKETINLDLNTFQCNKVEQWDSNLLLLALNKYKALKGTNFGHLVLLYKTSKKEGK